MTDTRDFLLEIGTEELPPKALRALSDALVARFTEGLDAAGLAHGPCQAFASPRRLAVLVSALADAQPEQSVEKRGPPVQASFDAAGQPTRAAEAFAAGCGVEVAALTRLETDKGAWLMYRAVAAGQPASALLPALAAAALAQLPIPRRMRWGAREVEFVRPVHWVVMLHGEDVVPGSLFDLPADRCTRGHRFMAPAPLELATAADYAGVLEREGLVIADFALRRARMLEACEQLAAQAGGALVADDALLDEITALVEWPVPLIGSFEAGYLELPPEVLIATLQGHQRYLPLRDAQGALLAQFIAVANIRSTEPAQVRLGNERVVRPRLADAAFFYAQDRRERLEARQAMLASVVFQRELGSLRDKSLRVAAAAGDIAASIGADKTLVERAALLAKCDLVTSMVGEFPELQGRMGRYYAQHDGEPAEVAAAIEEQYLPRFAGDRLPQTTTGRALAIADRLDTLAGIFALGQRPSGTRDPYGLRRAALGLLRILIEGGLELDLQAALSAALARQPATGAPDTPEALHAYVMERLRAYYLEGDEAAAGLTGEMLDAVLAMRPVSPLDVDRRLRAVADFLGRPEAPSLAAANKRVANLLRKAREAGEPAQQQVHDELLSATAERALAQALGELRAQLDAAAAQRDYAGLMSTLAGLRAPVDRFFDEVMVMDEDAAVRGNRLALLADLRAQFCRVADLSRLPG